MQIKYKFQKYSTLFVLIVVAQTAPGFSTNAVAAEKRPNFLFVFGEGQGWTSTSIQMDDTLPASKGDIVRTPNLERIAARGMRFANAYAPSPRCTPSRASVFTGKSPAQLHMTFVNEGGRASVEIPATRVVTPNPVMEMPRDEVMIGGLLKRAGYATAHFGKWHVGRVSPREHGYDETDGANNNGGPEDVETPNPKQAFAITQLGIEFMERQAKAGKPFYLQICHYAVRGPGGVLPETLDSVTQRAAARPGKQVRDRGLADIGVMEDMDTTVGLLLAKLKELGISDNTYIIYMPDHGTPGRNPPLAGGKGAVWEGGIRVPLLVAGPGIAPGVCSHVRVIGEDLFPTIAELAGIRELPKGVEGGSLVPLLIGGGKGLVKRPREEFVVHFPHYDRDSEGPASTILLGNYKLMRLYDSGALRLFDLSKDIGERNDLAKQMPDKVAELDRRLTEYLAAVGAQAPTINESIPPGQTPPDPKRKKGG
jgi:arylsulfatase A-like enzyme